MISHKDISLIPYTDYYAPNVWNWLNEYPAANFDDYGPRTFEEFRTEMDRRLKAGESAWIARMLEKPIGCIGYAPMTPQTGTFHGICFAHWVHGFGVARAAVQMVLDALFESGVQKVSASFFADNERIRRCLSGLGFEEEGLLRRQTMRGGRPVSMRLMAKFRGE